MPATVTRGVSRRDAEPARGLASERGEQASGVTGTSRMRAEIRDRILYSVRDGRGPESRRSPTPLMPSALMVDGCSSSTTASGGSWSAFGIA